MPPTTTATYLLVCDLVGHRVDFVVAQVDLGELVRLPPILYQLQVLEIDDLHGERSESLALHVESAALLGALEGSLDGFGAGGGRSSAAAALRGICSARLRLCTVVQVGVALRSCDDNIAIGGPEICPTRLLEKVRVRLSSHAFTSVVATFSVT